MARPSTHPASPPPSRAPPPALPPSQSFFLDTLASGQGESDVPMVRTLVTRSAAAVEWLAAAGVQLDAVTQTGGHAAPRTHHERSVDGKPRPVGWDIIAALQKRVGGDPGITVVAGGRVVELTQDAAGFTPDQPRGALPVTGVRYAPPGGGAHVELPADAVVLATGGYGCDHSATSLLTEFAPQLAAFPSTNAAGATGDGVKIARAAGAYLRGMHHVQVVRLREGCGGRQGWGRGGATCAV